jgi:hypothetical protein
MPDVFFKCVFALPGYCLLVETADGGSVFFGMKNRLGIEKFAPLADAELFASVATDGSYLIFGGGKVRIGAAEFRDIIMADENEGL